MRHWDNMYYLYLDESGESGIDYHDKRQPYFCITGFIIKEDQLSNVEIQVQELKKIIRIADNQEIHMTNIRKPKRLSLLYEKLWPILENNCLEIVNTGFNKAELDDMLAVDRNKLVRFEEIQTKIIPYVYGAYLTMLKFNHFLKEKNSLGRIFFDKKIQDELKVQEVFMKFSNKELLGEVISWDMISIDYLDSKHSAFIQLADILAYTFNKVNTFPNYPHERIRERENIIIDAYSTMGKFNVSFLEYDIGAILPAILSNHILNIIRELILKKKE